MKITEQVISVWRKPAAETEDYPGFVVHDGRVSGSITAGHSRLPLWSMIVGLVDTGWQSVAGDWEDPHITKEQLSGFLYYLLEQRGEFARLLCVLADVERQESESMRDSEAPEDFLSWYEQEDKRERVLAALQICVDILTVKK